MLLREIGPRQIEGPLADRHVAIIGAGPITVHIWDASFEDEGAKKSDIACLLSREVVRAGYTQPVKPPSAYYAPPTPAPDDISHVRDETVPPDIRWHLSFHGRHHAPPWDHCVRLARRIRPGVMWAAIAPPGADIVDPTRELHFWELHDDGLAALFATQPTALWERP